MYFSYEKCLYLTYPARFQTKSYHFGSKITAKFVYVLKKQYLCSVLENRFTNR